MEGDFNVTYEELFSHKLSEVDIQTFRELLLIEEQAFRFSFYSNGHSNAYKTNSQHYFAIDVTSEAIT